MSKNRYDKETLRNTFSELFSLDKESTKMEYLCTLAERYELTLPTSITDQCLEEFTKSAYRTKDSIDLRKVLMANNYIISDQVGKYKTIKILDSSVNRILRIYKFQQILRTCGHDLKSCDLFNIKDILLKHFLESIRDDRKIHLTDRLRLILTMWTKKRSRDILVGKIRPLSDEEIKRSAHNIEDTYSECDELEAKQIEKIHIEFNSVDSEDSFEWYTLLDFVKINK